MKAMLIDELQPGMIANQTICDARGTILIAQGIILTESYINRMRKFNIKKIDIKDMEEDTEPPCSLAAPIVKRTITTLGTLFDSLSEHNTIDIKKTSFQIEQVIYSILDKHSIQSFLEIDAQNELLYHHSLRTTVIAVNMGLAQGYDYLNLEYLAMCALMHDCGMGRDYLESDTDHALHGFKKLRDNLKMDMIIALVCLQHHEYFDGSGPLNFNRSQITEFARLIAIADHYDRLIIKKNSPRQALFKILGGSGTLFDPDMVKLFQATLCS